MKNKLISLYPRSTYFNTSGIIGNCSLFNVFTGEKGYKKLDEAFYSLDNYQVRILQTKIYPISEITTVMFAVIPKIRDERRTYIREVVLSSLYEIYGEKQIKNTKFRIRHIFLIEE